MISCIIVEDEPLATEKLSGYIDKIPFLELKSCFENGMEALNYMHKDPVDLIFLDIQMKELDGIHFLNALTLKPKIIITSAYSTYAIEGYEHSVSDFLLKPFGFDRLLKAVNRVSQDFTSKSSTETDFIFVKTEYRMEKLFFKDILFVEGMKDYLAIVTVHGKVMTLLSFNKILEVLPPVKFIRVHKSYIVAIERMEQIERNRIKIGKMLIPISETYKDLFYTTLKANKMIV